MVRTTLILLLFAFASCEKSAEYDVDYWCESFSREYDRYTFEVDTLGAVANLVHDTTAVPNVTLCGRTDIEAAHCCPFVKVKRWIPDSSTMTVFVDSTVIRYTQIN